MTRKLAHRAALAALYLLALILASCGLYAFRTFELIAKILALIALIFGRGTLISMPAETTLLAAQALLLTFCFVPLLALLVHRWLRWYWPTGLALIFFCAFQFSQQAAYMRLRAALPNDADPHANQCPWLSASGLTYLMSKALFLPPELLIDVNNEQCTTLKLAHDTELDMDTDWEVFKVKAYNPRFITTHYAQNALFPMGVAVAKAGNRMGGIPSDRNSAMAIVDKTAISIQMVEALVFVMEHQDRRLREQDAGGNPLALAFARLCTWEESSILNVYFSKAMGRLQALPEAEKKSPGISERLEAVGKRWKQWHDSP